jgi:hypothetical protein
MEIDDATRVLLQSLFFVGIAIVFFAVRKKRQWDFQTVEQHEVLEK